MKKVMLSDTTYLEVDATFIKLQNKGTNAWGKGRKGRRL